MRRLVVDDELTSNDGQFFVILVELPIEIIIVDLVEKSDVLNERLAIASRLDIEEILLVERDSSDSRVYVIIQARTWQFVLAILDILGNQTNHSFRTGNELLWNLESAARLEFGVNRACVRIWFNVAHMLMIQKDLDDCFFFVELRGDFIVWIEDGLRYLNGELQRWHVFK